MNLKLESAVHVLKFKHIIRDHKKLMRLKFGNSGFNGWSRVEPDASDVRTFAFTPKK